MIVTRQIFTLPRIKFNVPPAVVEVGDFPSGRHLHGLVTITNKTVALHFVTMQCGQHKVFAVILFFGEESRRVSSMTCS